MGKRHSPETKEKAIAMLAAGKGIDSIAEELKLPPTTVATWKTKEEKDEDYVLLRAKKKEEFVNAAWRSIELALTLGEKRVKRALEHEDELDTMISEIENDGDLHAATKAALITKLKTLQIQGIRDISTFVGTLYDKQALATGDPTNNLNGKLTVTLEGELEEWAK